MYRGKSPRFSHFARPSKIRFPPKLSTDPRTINTAITVAISVIGRVYQPRRYVFRDPVFTGDVVRPLFLSIILFLFQSPSQFDRTFTGKVCRLAPSSDDRMPDAIERYLRHDRNYIPRWGRRVVTPSPFLTLLRYEP